MLQLIILLYIFNSLIWLTGIAELAESLGAAFRVDHVVSIHG